MSRRRWKLAQVMGNTVAFVRDILEGAMLRWRYRTGEPCQWEFAVCAVFKNEARHLGEWLEFHRLVGVDHFFLYDDCSTDAFMAILQPWIEDDRVTLRSRNGRNQFEIYDHCLRNGARNSRWIAFIDLDEFLFSPTGQKLPAVMKRYASYPAVFVYWILFGSNGHTTSPHGGTLDSYTKSLSISSATTNDFVHRPPSDSRLWITGQPRNGKSIVDPRSVIRAGIHRPKRLVRGLQVDELFQLPATRSTASRASFSCDILRINHYWSRSLEELKAKIEKGVVDGRSDCYNLERSLEWEARLNEIHDDVILQVRESLSNTSR